MSHGTLKWLRLVTPGIIILILNGLLGCATGLWGFYWPENAQEAAGGVNILLIGAVYYILPFRRWSNRHYFKKVTEALRKRLIEIAGENDDPDIYSWKKIRGIFFSLVDGDQSLKVKSSQAYFNGYIWTSLADLRVLAGLMVLPSLGCGFVGLSGGWYAAILFASISLITLPCSSSVTKYHQSIGEQQIEIIEHNHLDTLRDKLRGVYERSAPSNSRD
ncbi:hypothetical protein H7H48_05540 [Nitratireductor sp. B36]|uniref:hypothetical protein n=1 Tax=Nitratireductor sp. B36 TaxID=2762059 RepID=UPI001E426354|nr:hypothetical protein [Nitratireductor sp. B36]MCC5778505.1 hypothetical protein [Nitratireductor sp. B36]